MGAKAREVILTQEQKDLMAMHYKLVPSICNRVYGTNDLTYDEIYDAAIDALIYTVQVFDEKKAKFSTLLFVIAKKTIRNKLRDKYAKKRMANNNAISLDKKVLGEEEDGETFARYLMVYDHHNFINVDLVNLAFTANLTEKEKFCIVGKYFYGLEVEQIRIAAGYAQKQQANKKQRHGLAKMKKVLEENGYDKRAIEIN